MCLPGPTAEAGAPFNKEFCKLLFVGKMVLVGNLQAQELEMFSSQKVRARI